MTDETTLTDAPAPAQIQDPIGVFAGLPNADYHGGPGVSKSGLDLIHRSPLHFDHARKTTREQTPAQRLGTAAHDLILEPEEFWNRYAIPLDPRDFPEAIHSRDELVARVELLNEGRLPKLSASGSKQELVDRILEAAADRYPADVLADLKVGDLKSIVAEINLGRQGLLSTRGTQRELAAILAEHGQPVELWADLVEMNRATNDGKTIISAEDFDQISAMRDAVMAHKSAGALLAPDRGMAELSAYWRDPETGALCRCRPDFLRKDGLVVDLKTAIDASPDGFSSAMNAIRYDVQAAFYLDGLREAIAQGREDLPAPKAFVFVAVEKTAPYAVATYLVPAETIEIGRREYRADLNRYAECAASNTWPGYGDAIQPLGLPEWRLRREEIQLEGETE